MNRYAFFSKWREAPFLTGSGCINFIAAFQKQPTISGKGDGLSLSCIFYLFLFLVTPFFLPANCYALDIYDAPPGPPGSAYTNYTLFYSADKLTDDNGDTAVHNLDLKVTKNLFRYTFFDKSLFKNTLGFDLVVPYGKVELLGDSDEGLGDITATFGYWFIDDIETKTWLLVAQFIDIPTGEYDKNKIANLGMNVWQFRPTIWFSKFYKKFDFDCVLKYNIYTENNDTDVKNGNELMFETLLGYYFTPTFMAAAHFDALWGEDMEINGHDVDDSAAQAYRAGISLDWTPSVQYGLNFKYLYDVDTQNSPRGDLFLFRFFIKLS